MLFQKVTEVLYTEYIQCKKNKKYERKKQLQKKKRIEKKKVKKQIKQKQQINPLQQKNQQQIQFIKIESNLKSCQKQQINSGIEQQILNQTQDQTNTIKEQMLEKQSQDITSDKVQRQQIQQKIPKITHQQKWKGGEQQMIQQTIKQDTKTSNQQKTKGKQSKQNKANKKIIKQRINQYYQCFCQQLSQVASTYDKYRRVVYSVIQHFLSTEFFQGNLPHLPQQNQPQNIKNIDWKLQVYGSSSTGFSLRHSDIDLVLLACFQKITLKQIYEKLRLQKWVIDCKFIQAQIPIINLQVNLQFSNVALNKLTIKQIKKISSELFSVDFTLSTFGELHSGIQNTKHLKQIFEIYPSIRNVCLLLKQYLRVKCLNKPYKGGINSYVLIMLVHAILSRKGIISPKDQQEANDQYRKIKQISQFMQQQFFPFQTVISSKKSQSRKPDKCLHLNLINSKTDQFVKTSAFNIQIIVMELKKFRQFQENMEKQLLTLNINQKKNMKHLFLEELKNFLSFNQN